jgi:hypothetical protein
MNKQSQLMRRIVTLVTPEEHRAVKEFARARNTTVSNVIRRAFLLPDREQGKAAHNVKSAGNAK